MTSDSEVCPACKQGVKATQTKVGEANLLCSNHHRELNGYLEQVVDNDVAQGGSANTTAHSELAQEAQSEAPSVGEIMDELCTDTVLWQLGDISDAMHKAKHSVLEAKINRLILEAKQEPVGAALEIKVAPETMQAVMARIKMTDKNIADRVLEPLWRIEVWRKGTGDTYDYEVEQWKLRILAHLTRRFNWASFLLKPDNLDVLRTKAALSNNLSKEQLGER